MDQQKIGEFLKCLRKEKGLTQEQLAECMNVSTRTISRWETGANLPELELLVWLAKYYEISVGEILDGEKLCQQQQVSCPEEDQKIFEKVADYSRINESQLLTKIVVLVGIGMVAWVVSFLFLLIFALSAKGMGILLAFEGMALMLYSVMMFRRKEDRSVHEILYGVMGAGVAVSLSNVVLTVLFFGSGRYRNYGIQGAYYTFFVVGIVFAITGVVTRWLTTKKQKNM